MRRPNRYRLLGHQVKMSMHPVNCYNIMHVKPLDEQNLTINQIEWKSKTLCRLYFNGDVTYRSFLKVYDRCKRNMHETLATMERRLDNVLFRSLFAESVYDARKMVSDGMVLLNEQETRIPSKEMKDGDLLQIKPKYFKEIYKVADNPWINFWAFIPKYLEVSYLLPGVVFLRQPKIEEIPSPYPLRMIDNMASWFSERGHGPQKNYIRSKLMNELINDPRFFDFPENQ